MARWWYSDLTAIGFEYAEHITTEDFTDIVVDIAANNHSECEHRPVRPANALASFTRRTIRVEWPEMFPAAPVRCGGCRAIWAFRDLFSFFLLEPRLVCNISADRAVIRAECLDDMIDVIQQPV